VTGLSFDLTEELARLIARPASTGSASPERGPSCTTEAPRLTRPA